MKQAYLITTSALLVGLLPLLVIAMREGAIDGLVAQDGQPSGCSGRSVGQVVGSAGQGGLDPQQVAREIDDDLHVHAVAAVLPKEVGPAVTTSSTGRCARPAAPLPRCSAAPLLRDDAGPAGGAID